MIQQQQQQLFSIYSFFIISCLWLFIPTDGFVSVIVKPSHPIKKQSTIQQLNHLVVDPSKLWMSSTSTDSSTASKKKKFPPSTVIDTAGPTPIFDPRDVTIMNDVDEIPGIKEFDRISDMDNNPIPYQTWRRGITNGCEDPITAEWRIKAEESIYKSALLVGGTVLDITWYLTTCLITIDDINLPEFDYTKSYGPVIDIIEPTLPQYSDPNDPEPIDIWDDEDDVLYDRTDITTQKGLKQTPSYATYDSELDQDDIYNNDEENPSIVRKQVEERMKNEKQDPKKRSTDRYDVDNLEHKLNIDLLPNQAGNNDMISLYMDQETRDDIANLNVDEQKLKYDESEHPIIDLETSIYVNTNSISIVGDAILRSLQLIENEVHVLNRHEIVLSGPTPDSSIIETQKQFNQYRNHFVIVQTIDPFQSNRILKGKVIYICFSFFVSFIFVMFYFFH